MRKPSFSKIIGTGSYLPERIMTNHDLEKLVDTSDEWIRTRTGISSRRIAASGETSSDLAVKASKAAIENASITTEQIDLIIVATTTPDMLFPSTACILQSKLGVKQGAAFDVQAVCSGFIYALATADSLIRSGVAKTALVVGSEVLSSIVDWSDRSTCVLFGDGAGAVILKESETAGILSSKLYSDGSMADVLMAPAKVANGKIEGHPFIKMQGSAVFKFAVHAFVDAANAVLADNQMLVSDLTWFVPHQANQRIIQASAEKLGLRDDQAISTVATQGNTSAASIPLVLDQLNKEHKLKPHDSILIAAVGGGLTWGASLIRW